MRLGVCSGVIVTDADRQTTLLADSMVLDDSHLLEAGPPCSYLQAAHACSFSHLDTLTFGHTELTGL